MPPGKGRRVWRDLVTLGESDVGAPEVSAAGAQLVSRVMSAHKLLTPYLHFALYFQSWSLITMSRPSSGHLPRRKLMERSLHLPAGSDSTGPKPSTSQQSLTCSARRRSKSSSPSTFAQSSSRTSSARPGSWRSCCDSWTFRLMRAPWGWRRRRRGRRRSERPTPGRRCFVQAGRARLQGTVWH